MTSILIRITTTVVALVFSGSVALAAGSSPMPATDKRPGVTEYNAGVKLMKEGKYQEAQKKFEAALAKSPNMAPTSISDLFEHLRSDFAPQAAELSVASVTHETWVLHSG